MKTVLAILLLAASSALAQQPTPEQREYQQRVVDEKAVVVDSLLAQIAEWRVIAKDLDRKLAEALKKCSDACKPKEEAKK